MKTLKESEGELILLISPFFDRTKIQKVRLLKLEDAGIWIESQEFTESALKLFGQTSAPKTMVVFLPWHQITCVLDSLDVPALSEQAAKL